MREHLRSHRLHVGECDHRAGRGVPESVSPLLEEVRIAPAGLDEHGEGVVGEVPALAAHRDPQGVGGGGRREGADGAVEELALRVRAVAGQDRGKIGQSGTDEEERPFPLARPVLDGEQRRQQIGVEVLHLVDEQSEGTGSRPQFGGDRLDEFLEVEVDVPAGRRGLVEGEARGGRPEAEAEGETPGEIDERIDRMLDPVLAAVTAQSDGQLLGELGADGAGPGLVGSRLEGDRQPTLPVGVLDEGVEQGRLPDSPQSRQDESTVVVLPLAAGDEEFERPDLLVASLERRRPEAGAGLERVELEIHEPSIETYGDLSEDFHSRP